MAAVVEPEQTQTKTVVGHMSGSHTCNPTIITFCHRQQAEFTVGPHGNRINTNQ